MQEAQWYSLVYLGLERATWPAFLEFESPLDQSLGRSEFAKRKEVQTSLDETAIIL